MFEKIKQYWVVFVSLGLLAVSGLFVAQKQEMFGAGYNPVTGYTSKTTSYVSPTATTIPVVSTKDPSGQQIDLSKISDAPIVKVYMNIEPGTPNQEPIMCTGLTPSSWTGCTRGLEFQGGTETASTTLQKAHNAGSAIIITNIGQSFNQFVAISGDQSIGGVKNFTEFPTFNTSTQLPSQDGEFATKYYVDQVGAGGFTAANVSTTRGLSVDGSAPERVGINASSTTGMAFDAQGKLYQIVNGLKGLASAIDGIFIKITSKLSFNESGELDVITSDVPSSTTIAISDENGFVSKLTPYTSQKVLFAETVTTGTAVYVATGSSTNQLYSVSGLGGDSYPTFSPQSVTFRGQTFTTGANTNKITRIRFYIDNAWGPSNIDGSVYVYATSGGLPTSTPIASTTYSGYGGLIDWYVNLNVTSNTMYAFAMNSSLYSGTKQGRTRATTGVYSGGTYVYSSNSGSTWTSDSGSDLVSEVYTIDATGGGILKTTALTNTERANNFVGFSVGTYTTSSYGYIATAGTASLFSGLTPGSAYYLSDTFGAIQTTTGTVAKKVGLSINSSTLLIKNDN